MHVGIANPRSRGKRSRHSRRMRNPQFYVSGKRPIQRILAWNNYCNGRDTIILPNYENEFVSKIKGTRVTADGLTPISTKSFVGSIMTKFGSGKFMGLTLEGLGLRSLEESRNSIIHLSNASKLHRPFD